MAPAQRSGELESSSRRWDEDAAAGSEPLRLIPVGLRALRDRPTA